MKKETIIKILLGALALILIIAIIWGISANHKIQTLNNDYNVSLGKNKVYEQQALVLQDSINKLNESYFFLQKRSDSMMVVYTKRVSDQNKIIEKYKKEQQTIAGLSGLKTMEYFNARIGSESPVIVIPSTDTVFAVPEIDIRAANEKFVEGDKLLDLNYNLRQREDDLLKINEGLKLEIKNRQSAVDKLTELNNNKDLQIGENKKQIEDLNKTLKKEKRKSTFQKIGIGAAGVGAFILALTL